MNPITCETAYSVGSRSSCDLVGHEMALLDHALLLRGQLVKHLSPAQASHRRASISGQSVETEPMNERSHMREVMMGKDDDGNSLDRRTFLGASTATLLGLPGIGLAQQQKPSGPGKGSDLATQAPSQAIADFVTGFDLKSAPPIVIERARIAFEARRAGRKTLRHRSDRKVGHCNSATCGRIVLLGRHSWSSELDRVTVC
jgi:hypothetical protein